MPKEKWVSFNLSGNRRSGVIVKRNRKTIIVKLAEFNKGRVYRTVKFVDKIKLHFRKNQIVEYPETIRPVY